MLQLTAYGVAGWLVFVAVIFTAARLGGIVGLLVGQVLVAIVVVTLDLIWVLGEMGRPDWSGVPDADILFQIGVFIRVVLINTMMLPIGLAGCLARRRAKRSLPLTEHPSADQG
ncbi:MAG: hypothetical protein AAF078_04590 [Planctomycetota bacterium]